MDWVKKSDSIIYNSLLNNIRVWQIFGIYPINNWPLINYYTYSLLAYLILICPIPLMTPAYFLLYQKSERHLQTSETLMLTTQLGINFFVKFGYLRLQPNSIAKLFEWLREPMFNCIPENDKNILDKALKSYYLLGRIGYVTNIVCVSFWILKMLMDENQMPSVLFGDKSIYLKTCMYTLVILGLYHNGFANMSFNLILIGLIYHATVQIRIIKSIMENLHVHASHHPEHLRNDIVYRQIAHCAQRFWLVKNFVNDIESTFSLPLFCHVCVSILVYCCICMQFFKGDSAIIYPMTALICKTFEDFMYCFIGNVLYEETYEFNTNLYFTDWLRMDLKCQKAFIIFREIVQKPIVFRAGKLLDISLQTFAMIARRSYSLMTVLFKYR